MKKVEQSPSHTLKRLPRLEARVVVLPEINMNRARLIFEMGYRMEPNQEACHVAAIDAMCAQQKLCMPSPPKFSPCFPSRHNKLRTNQTSDWSYVLDEIASLVEQTDACVTYREVDYQNDI